MSGKEDSAMKAENGSALSPDPLQDQTSNTLTGSRLLTASEQEQLRQDKKEAAEFFRKRWAHLRTKT